jgi:hypothetical protein
MAQAGKASLKRGKTQLYLYRCGRSVGFIYYGNHGLVFSEPECSRKYI